MLTNAKDIFKSFEEAGQTVMITQQVDCIAGNLILWLNKLQYKDGKGDPRGFKAFLDSHKLSHSYLQRESATHSVPHMSQMH